MEHIILLGKPGSGKGTLSKKLIKKGFYQLSGSDILRENSQDTSAKYYKEARHALDSGVLVSSDIINGMVIEKLNQLGNTPIVFDGFPRTIEQADMLLNYYNQDKNKKIKAIYLDIEDDVIIDRISNRITCVSCSSTFNKRVIDVSKPCPSCQGKLIQRPDDNANTLTVRLDQYETHTLPVIDYLKSFISLEKLSLENINSHPLFQ